MISTCRAFPLSIRCRSQIIGVFFTWDHQRLIAPGFPRVTVRSALPLLVRLLRSHDKSAGCNCLFCVPEMKDVSLERIQSSLEIE
jgi:hypothetical protein